MLLAIDVGNTHTVIGLFEKQTLVADWRVGTHSTQTTDELGLLLSRLLSDSGRDPKGLDGIAVSSVVPILTGEYREVGDLRFGCPTLVIDYKTVGIPILNHDPMTVGADRLVNALAARTRYGAPVIVVDLGTATTLDVVDADGAYAGGVITPGVATAANALFQRGARLARVEIARPERVVGRNTEESIQAGVFFGAVGGIDALVHRIVAEQEFAPGLSIVATGGLAAALAEASETITDVDQSLTLEGIRLAWEKRLPA